MTQRNSAWLILGDSQLRAKRTSYSYSGLIRSCEDHATRPTPDPVSSYLCLDRSCRPCACDESYKYPGTSLADRLIPYSHFHRQTIQPDPFPPSDPDSQTACPSSPSSTTTITRRLPSVPRGRPDTIPPRRISRTTPTPTRSPTLPPTLHTPHPDAHDPTPTSRRPSP